MDKQVETTFEPIQDQVDFRGLLDIEIVSIGGGDTIVGLY